MAKTENHSKDIESGQHLRYNLVVPRTNHRKGMAAIYRQEIIHDITLLTSQVATSFSTSSSHRSTLNREAKVDCGRSIAVPSETPNPADALATTRIGTTARKTTAAPNTRLFPTTIASPSTASVTASSVSTLSARSANDITPVSKSAIFRG